VKGRPVPRSEERKKKRDQELSGKARRRGSGVRGRKFQTCRWYFPNFDNERQQMLIGLSKRGEERQVTFYKGKKTEKGEEGGRY